MEKEKKKKGIGGWRGRRRVRRWGRRRRKVVGKVMRKVMGKERMASGALGRG